MTNENNKVNINKHEIDIETLKKQNVNDLCSIKQLYSKLKKVEEKIIQIKYIDSTLANKLKKEYEKLKTIILDENIQVQLVNEIDELKSNVNDNNSRLDTNAKELNSKIDNNVHDINLKKASIEELKGIKQQVNNLVLGAVGDGNNAEVIQSRGKFNVLNERIEAIENSKALKIFDKSFKRSLVNSRNLLNDCFLDEVYDLVNTDVTLIGNTSNILFLSHTDSEASFKINFNYFNSSFSEETTIYLHFKAKVLKNESTGYNTPSLTFQYLLDNSVKGAKGKVLEFTNDFKEYVLPITFAANSSRINNFKIFTQKPFDIYFKDLYISFYEDDEFGFSLFDKEESQDKEIIRVENKVDDNINVINKINDDVNSITEPIYEDITSNLTLNINGFYKYDSGNIISNDSGSYAYFSPIKIENTDKYIITGQTSSYANLYIITNDSGTILTAYPNKIVDGTVFEKDIEVVIPSGGTKLLVNSINNSTIIKKGNGIKIKGVEPLAKLNLAIIGDSLSDDTIEPHTKYHSYLKNNYNVKVLAVSGSGYFNPSSHNTQFYNQAKNVTLDDDIIMIFGSFNDMSRLNNGEVTMGTITDKGTTTIYGCINTTLDNIYAINPNAIICLVTPTPWRGMNEQITENNPYYPFVHGYIRALHDVATKRQIPILDLFHCSNLRPWIEENRNEYYHNADGTHPNEKAHKRYLYPQFREFLRSMNWNL